MGFLEHHWICDY